MSDRRTGGAGRKKDVREGLLLALRVEAPTGRRI
jgi:hypothetical protein